MKNNSTATRKKLFDIINEMSRNTSKFVKNPTSDFTRCRKLPFEEVIKVTLSMSGNTLDKELIEYFNYDTSTPTSSAFIQQRNKILPVAFECLFNEFTNYIKTSNNFLGYRLLAIDGSALSIAHNPSSKDTYVKASSRRRGFNLLHINAMYDLLNNIYIDAVIQPKKNLNENKALVKMVNRLDFDINSIVIADRGYESYNNFAHINQSGFNYLIRVKDITSSGIAGSLNLPNSDEFDTDIDICLTKKQTKHIKNNKHYFKFIPKNGIFDFFGTDSFYPMSFRVVRFKITDDSYETIITNLQRDQFNPKVIKQLYGMRWGIETSFRSLKYSTSLICVHSKTVENISKEIFAKLTLYNFCSCIISNTASKTKSKKYTYSVNFNYSVKVCTRLFFPRFYARPPNVEAIISKHCLPVRPNRTFKRNVNTKSPINFNYRVS